MKNREAARKTREKKKRLEIDEVHKLRCMKEGLHLEFSHIMHCYLTLTQEVCAAGLAGSRHDTLRAQNSSKTSSTLKTENDVHVTQNKIST